MNGADENETRVADLPEPSENVHPPRPPYPALPGGHDIRTALEQPGASSNMSPYWLGLASEHRRYMRHLDKCDQCRAEEEGRSGAD